MSAPRIPRVSRTCGGACEQGRKSCDCWGYGDEEDNLPHTLDDLVCAVLMVFVFSMLIWAEPLGRFIEGMSK